jgi:hypothetical protein
MEIQTAPAKSRSIRNATPLSLHVSGPDLRQGFCLEPLDTKGLEPSWEFIRIFPTAPPGGPNWGRAVGSATNLIIEPEWLCSDDDDYKHCIDLIRVENRSDSWIQVGWIDKRQNWRKVGPPIAPGECWGRSSDRPLNPDEYKRFGLSIVARSVPSQELMGMHVVGPGDLPAKTLVINNEFRDEQARRRRLSTPVPVKVNNQLSEPYRTGSYLIYDTAPGDGLESEHFRNAMTLRDHPYRASGSHQLNAQRLGEILEFEVVEHYHPSNIFLVDLRQEAHGFFDGVAVSWYADNDFANVGQPLSWIVEDEAARLAMLENKTTQVFEIDKHPPDNRIQQRVAPKSYQEIAVAKAYTEATFTASLNNTIGCAVTYVRMPATDHCAPMDAALDQLRDLWTKIAAEPAAWVHFHCHGGDGRTTTFLALFDMLCWKRSNDPLPSREEFACRQCELFSYCLNPSGCGGYGKCTKPATDDWKLSLAQVRWAVLEDFRQKVAES